MPKCHFCIKEPKTDHALYTHERRYHRIEWEKEAIAMHKLRLEEARPPIQERGGKHR